MFREYTGLSPDDRLEWPARCFFPEAGLLTRVAYSSQAARDLSLDELQALLAEARERNDAAGIGGALVYVDGVFLQILEGESAALSALMDKIAQDPRHRDVKVFERAAIDTRAFGDWRMAYLTPSATQVSAWAGLEAGVTIEALLADMRSNPQLLPRVLISIVGALADD